MPTKDSNYFRRKLASKMGGKLIPPSQAKANGTDFDHPLWYFRKNESPQYAQEIRGLILNVLRHEYCQDRAPIVLLASSPKTKIKDYIVCMRIRDFEELFVGRVKEAVRVELESKDPFTFLGRVERESPHNASCQEPYDHEVID